MIRALIYLTIKVAIWTTPDISGNDMMNPKVNQSDYEN